MLLHDGDVVDAYHAGECAVGFEIKRQCDGLITETCDVMIVGNERACL